MCEEKTEAAEPIDRQLYLEHRKSLVELGVAQIGLFDKTLLLLSTGALGASALFVDTFVGDDALKFQPVLALSWAAFATTMLLNLLSYLSSWHDMETERNAWDEKYQAGDISIPHSNGWRATTQWLNSSAFISFLLGLVTLLVFCFNNI